MPVTERQRHDLHAALSEQLGGDVADTLMDLLPPVGWADVATRHDVGHLEAVMDAKFETVNVRFDRADGELDQLRSDVNQRMSGLERQLEQLRADIGQLRGQSDDRWDRTQAQFDAVRAEANRNVYRVVGLQTAAIAAASVLLRAVG